MSNLKILKTMVTIVDYKSYQKEDGEKFFGLIVQGGIEAVKSKETGRTYLTARTARVSCTFNEPTCVSLIGTKLPGTIQKVEVEPYEYTIPDTGEIVELNYRFEFMSEEDGIVRGNLVEAEEVM